MTKPFDIDKFGSAAVYRWTHDHLVKVLCYSPNSPVTEPRIKEAFRTIIREDFINEKDKEFAYEDKPLEISHGQTISQPTVVAQMLQLLNPAYGGKYLDIGSGSGYVASLLGKIAGPEGKVIGLERIQLLAEKARENISKYPELKNISVYFKDGSKGYTEEAPYDGIHVGAAYEEIPQDLIDQIKVGGRIVAPTQNDDIRLITKKSDDEIEEKIFEGFVFVPIVEGVI